MENRLVLVIGEDINIPFDEKMAESTRTKKSTSYAVNVLNVSADCRDNNYSNLFLDFKISTDSCPWILFLFEDHSFSRASVWINYLLLGNDKVHTFFHAK